MSHFLQWHTYCDNLKKKYYENGKYKRTNGKHLSDYKKVSILGSRDFSSRARIQCGRCLSKTKISFAGMRSDDPFVNKTTKRVVKIRIKNKMKQIRLLSVFLIFFPFAIFIMIFPFYIMTRKWHKRNLRKIFWTKFPK